MKYLYLILLWILFAIKLVNSEIISEARLMGVPEDFYNGYIKPYKGQEILKAKFSESYHKGSYRKIGRSQAEFILKNDPDYKTKLYKFVHTLVKKDSLVWDSTVRKKEELIIRKRLSEFFPEIIDEIEGFADVIGIPYEDALKIYSNYGLAGEDGGNIFGSCTLFVIGKDKSSTGNILIGRSYEFLNSFCEIAVVGVKPEGAYASAGYTQFNLGRVDGINEHGLFIGVASSIAKQKNKNGFLFPIIIRAVLDKARNVDEAIEILNRAPRTEGNNFLIADQSGRAVVVEAVPFKPLSLRWLKDDKEGSLIVTNHYQNRETKGDNIFIMPNSYERVHTVKRLIGGKSVKTSKSDISKILKGHRPDGVYWNDYTWIFGTLHSGVYDLDEVSWSTSSGKHQLQLSKGDIAKAERKNSEVNIEFENNQPFPLDYIQTSPYGVIDINTFYSTGRLLFLSSPVPLSMVEFTANYKQTISGNEKTYGPNITYSVAIALTPAFSRIGAKIAINPLPLLSLELMPFYYYGWRVYSFTESSEDNSKTIIDNLKNGKNESNYSTGIIVNPIIRFGGLLTIENKLSFFNFRETVYEYETNLLINKTAVWSPSLTLLIPYSKNFSWGMQAMSNFEFSEERYNVSAGPLFVFPKVVNDFNLILSSSYWFKLPESKDRINIIAGIMGRIF